MKLFCAKTEEDNKYLVKNIFEDTAEIFITEKGTSIETDEVKVFVLDMRSNNAEIINTNSETPLDFEPAQYFYYKESDVWEKVPEIVLPEIQESDLDLLIEFDLDDPSVLELQDTEQEAKENVNSTP